MTSFLQADALTFHGPDAIAFAQTQFSSDVKSLQKGYWQWSAWLNAQGRIRALMQLILKENNTLLILLRGGSSLHMVEQLQPFVMRKKVQIQTCPTYYLVDAAHVLPQGNVLFDDNRITFGYGNYAIYATTKIPSAATQKWRTQAIDSGHPWLPNTLTGQILASSSGLSRLDALSLNKGCYPGQEIVARIHYRGKQKQDLYRVKAINNTLTPGTPVHYEGKLWGHILDAVTVAGESYGLAVLRHPPDVLENPISMQTENQNILLKINTIYN